MRRLWIVFGFFCVLFFVIALRLFYWQILTGDTLRLEAAQQYSMKLTVPARRGTLYAGDGSPIVLNQPAYLVYAKPKEISNTSIFSRDVGKILGIDREKIEERLSVPNLVWVPLAHKVEEAIVKELSQLVLFPSPHSASVTTTSSDSFSAFNLTIYPTLEPGL